jgi:hypothetical protein
VATPRKHWFKVADSIGDEDWDNDVLATLIRLQARLNTKWARNGLVGEEAGRITLTAGDAMAVTRRSSFARALALLRRCTHAVSMLLHESRAAVKIEWPKWPEFQGLPSRELPESRPLRDSDSDAPARLKTQREESAPPAPESPAAPRPSARRVLVEKPEAFPDESKERLRVWAARKGISRDLMNAGLEIFRDWTPLKPPYRRTVEQWEGAFKKIVREGVASGMIGKPELKSGAPRYRDADDVIAEAKRKQAQDEARAATESPEEVGRLIDMALRRERA